jgi:beta-glucosidase
MGRTGTQPNATPLAIRTEPNVNLSDSDLPSEVAGKKTLGVHWTGFITPTKTGNDLVGLRGVGFGRLSIDDMQVAMLLAHDGVD